MYTYDFEKHCDRQISIFENSLNRTFIYNFFHHILCSFLVILMRPFDLIFGDGGRNGNL